MNNQNISPEMSYPWYDDRVKVLQEEEPARQDWPWDTLDEEGDYDTPKKIYGYLDQYVWKQEEAKKAASVIAYNCFERRIKTNAMFVGPTGCGKTFTWRCVKRIFPDRIEIVDGSNLTQDGWKGEKKWSSLFRSPIFRSGERSILVIDEADKMLYPKFTSGGENVSHSIQAEGLTMMEGARVEVKDGSVAYEIDTSKISFVFCGAFSSKAQDMAREERGSSIGFGAAPKEVRAYSKPMREEDLIAFGVMPEFMGRIQRVVSLEAMTIDDYYRMMEGSNSLLGRIRRQYRADIHLTQKTRHELAERALRSGLGIRGMENRIRAMMDEALFEDCDRRRFEF